MKIVCDACGAKYAIADEKVRGKVFKIRCKKCSNVIVVRGLSGEGDAADESLSQQETRTFGYDEQEGAETASSEGVWHLVIDQDQIGPITDEEVRERFARGEIDRETYAWREGFGDWLPLASIDVFADLGSGHASPGRPAGASAGSAESPAADPFSAADSGGDGGGDLFGGANAGDGLFGDNGAGSAADRRLRGERNENSVLFSLGNLAALASDAPKVSAPSAAMGAAPAGRAQAGGSEGSGLIDIRSMAQSYLGGKDRGGAAVPMGSFGPVEPVSFSTQSPVLLPQTPVSGGGNNKTLIAAIIGGSAAVVVAVVVVLIIVLRGGDGPTVAEGTPGAGTDPTGEATNPDTPPGTPTPDPKAAGTGTEKPAGTDPGTTATPPSDTPPADIAGRKPDEGKTPRTPTPGRSDREPGSSRTPSSGSREPDKTEKPADKPAPTPPASGGGCLDEVGCLLADKPPACCSKYSGGGGGSKKPGGGSGGDSNLPEKLTRSDITAGINKVRGGVTGCSSKGSGEVKVTVKVDGSGSVGDVSVKSAPNAALGTCVANAVKKAKFAKTQDGATFTYPFVF